jgi:hypothetical protein
MSYSNKIEEIKLYQNSNVEINPVEKKNIEYVRNLIQKHENPNPLLITYLVLLILVVVYVIYILYIKENISGIWFGNIENLPNTFKYKIKHNPFLDTLTIKWNGGKSNGKLIGRTIILYNNLGNEISGVLINKNTIKWIDSNDVWNNVNILS